MTGFDVDAWLDDYKPHTAEARICTRFDLLEQHAKIEAQLAGETGEARRKSLARKVVKLEAEIEAVEKVFTFTDIGGQWMDLIGQHPPTADQLKADRNLDHNPETFPVAAVAASSHEPKLTEDQVARLRRKLQHTQWQKVWAAALEANLGLATAPKSVLAGLVLRRNGSSGTTPAPEASPAASSYPGNQPTSSPRSNGRPNRTTSAPAAAAPTTRPSGPTTATSGTPRSPATATAAGPGTVSHRSSPVGTNSTRPSVPATGCGVTWTPTAPAS